jgi:hypothetical protein
MPPTDLIATWSHRLFFRGADHSKFTLAVTCFAAIVFAEMIFRPKLSGASNR